MSGYIKKAKKQDRGFSLAEVLAVLIIGSMVIVAVLGVYNRTQRGIAAVSKRLDSVALPREVLQLIAEDIDGIVADDENTRITIENKSESHGFVTARMEILKEIYGKNNQLEVYERIIWQGNYDGALGSLVIYRSRGGLAPEDKLLDEKKEQWERELFVPVCQGVTFFSIQVPGPENFINKWTNKKMPVSVVATISFAEPFKTAGGTWEIPEEKKISRTIAVNRIRDIKFTYVSPLAEEDETEVDDANGLENIEDVEEANDGNQIS